MDRVALKIKDVAAAALPALAYIKARPGVERVRITHDGWVHAYGIMPHTNQPGWYLAGDVETLADMARIQTAMALAGGAS